MKIRTIPRPTCPLCGSRGSVLYSEMRDRMFGVPGNWPLKECTDKKCGLCWMDPAPIEADISKIYTNYFTHEISETAQRYLSYIRSLLYGGYLAIAYIPSMTLGLNKARKGINHMFLHDMPAGKLLDVGCGSGIFLNRMHKLGWSVTGLDFDAKAIEYAKSKYGSDLTFLHSDLSSAGFSSNTFDAVTLSHVIEHVPDPVSLLEACGKILKPDSRLVVTTPNIRSFGHKKFHDCWFGLDAPRHLQIFSLDALRNCAIKAGFSKIKVFSTAANADAFIGGSLGFIEAKETGNCSSGSRVKINMIRGLRSLMLKYKEAIQIRRDPECGEELVLICQK